MSPARGNGPGTVRQDGRGPGRGSRPTAGGNMASSTQQSGRDPLGNAAAVAVLVVAALEAKRIVGAPNQPARVPDTASEADDVAAVSGSGGMKGRVDAFQASRPPLAFGV